MKEPMKTASTWLQKSCKFAFASEKMGPVMAEGMEADLGSAEKDDSVRDYVQWMTSNNKSFFPASRVTEILKPGFYEIKESMSQGLYFGRVPLNYAGLLKFPDSTADEVIAEIEKFWDSESLFKENKLPYKRGLLLYGPPGSGKTSCIKIIMQNLLKRDGVVIKFEHPRLFEVGMKMLREIQPDVPVVALMEDLDAILYSCNESDVINILDGVVPMHKVVFLGTTNHPEKLGSRIMNRPSRFDKRFEIGMPSVEARRIYFKDKLGEKIGGSELAKWVEDTENMSIAHLKELIVNVKILGNPYDEAISTLKGMSTGVHSREFDPYTSKH